MSDIGEQRGVEGGQVAAEHAGNVGQRLRELIPPHVTEYLLHLAPGVKVNASGQTRGVEVCPQSRSDWPLIWEKSGTFSDQISVHFG